MLTVIKQELSSKVFQFVNYFQNLIQRWCEKARGPDKKKLPNIIAC